MTRPKDSASCQPKHGAGWKSSKKKSGTNCGRLHDEFPDLFDSREYEVGIRGAVTIAMLAMDGAEPFAACCLALRGLQSCFVNKNFIATYVELLQIINAASASGPDGPQDSPAHLRDPTMKINDVDTGVVVRQSARVAKRQSQPVRQYHPIGDSMSDHHQRLFRMAGDQSVEHRDQPIADLS